MEQYYPGTTVLIQDTDDLTAWLASILRVTDGLSLSQICSLCGIEPTTIQNWVKRGYIPRPVNKKYYEKHLYRILLISSLKEGLQIDQVNDLMVSINGDVEDESDDIISDAKLYEIFCSIVIQDVSADQIDPLIALTAGENNRRLFLGLRIMVSSYLASLYKKQIKEDFADLKKLSIS